MVLSLSLLSCSNDSREECAIVREKPTSVLNKRKSIFIEKHRDSFAASDLVLFDYNPRSKFAYYSNSASYNIPLHSKSKIRINNEGDGALLDTNDKVQKVIYNFLNFTDTSRDDMVAKNFRIPDWIGKDSLGNFFLINDSNDYYSIPNSVFSIDPIIYFSELESLISEMEILSIVLGKNEVRVIFGRNHGLVYFPSRPTVKDTLHRNLRMIDDYWFENKGEVSIGY